MWHANAKYVTHHRNPGLPTTETTGKWLAMSYILCLIYAHTLVPMGFGWVNKIKLMIYGIQHDSHTKCMDRETTRLLKTGGNTEI